MLRFMTSPAASARKWPPFLEKHRREALDLGALGLSFLAVGSFIASVPVLAALGAALLAAFLPPPAAHGRLGPVAAAGVGVARKIAIVALTGCLLRFWLNAPLLPLWFGAFWLVLPLAPAAGRRAVRTARAFGPAVLGGPLRQEVLRCALLAAGTLWLMRGFVRRTLNGTDDALWYATMLADMVAQVRAGVFPVWVGQSIYQFNGAIYPLRVAPAFHYLGALLDALTFRTLGVFALQNLLLTLVAFAAMASAYLCLRRLLPAREWLAAALAALFLSCPGVLGIAYNMDLFMSWTTVPLVPVVWFATVRSFQSPDRAGPLVMLGAALGLSWWGHSPIALWLTILAACTQAARIVRDGRQGFRWRPALAGAAAFALIAAYPVGSVLLFPPEAGTRADSFQRATAGTIAFFLQKAFPGTMLPLSERGRSLGDFQVGYALWALLFLTLVCQRGARRAEIVAASAAAVALAVLLLPIPLLDQALWSVVPAFVRNTTGNWVMNRLYLPLAGAVVFGAGACASLGLMDSGRRRLALAILVTAGCAWSFLEATKFGNGSNAFIRTPESAVDQLRPENVKVTRFAYLVFRAPPSTFTNGVSDPVLENHLLSAATLGTAATNGGSAMKSAHTVDEGDFDPADGAADGFIGIGKKLRIEPGHAYLLAFDFGHPEVPGVVQVAGPHFFREYALPEYGGARAFGAGGEHPSWFPVWTTAGPQDVSVHFVPIPPLPAGSESARIGHVRLLEYDPDRLPVRVESWIPYKARVDSAAPAWLETPRMFQEGYVATVDGAPAAVRKSPDGFACVSVPAGRSQVVLAYRAPAGLQLLFWTSSLSVLGVAVLGLAARPRRSEETLRAP
jgi:hypothetical protein